MQSVFEEISAAAPCRAAARRELGEQFLRYVVVGGFAFIVDAGLLFVLTSAAHMHYLVSAALSFLAGLVTNYALSRSWVFRKRAIANGKVEFAIFALIGIVGLGLNQVLMWTFTDVLGVYYMLSKCGAAGVVLIWTFLSRKYILFSSAGPNAIKRV